MKKEIKFFDNPQFDKVMVNLRENVEPMTLTEIIAMQAKAIVELEQKIDELEAVQVKQIKDIEYLKTILVNRPNYYSIICFADKVKIKVGLGEAKKLGEMCVKLCEEKGYITEKIEDPRFGYIRTYPHDVLEEVFEKEYSISFD